MCLLSCCTGDYLPLNPVLSPQVSKVDIYPGLAAGIGLSTEAWNSYVTTVPGDSTLQYLYDTGRADTAAWVAANFPSKAGEVEQAMSDTASYVNAVPVTDLAAAAVNLLGVVTG